MLIEEFKLISVLSTKFVILFDQLSKRVLSNLDKILGFQNSIVGFPVCVEV